MTEVINLISNGEITEEGKTFLLTLFNYSLSGEKKTTGNIASPKWVNFFSDPDLLFDEIDKLTAWLEQRKAIKPIDSQSIKRIDTTVKAIKKHKDAWVTDADIGRELVKQRLQWTQATQDVLRFTLEIECSPDSMTEAATEAAKERLDQLHQQMNETKARYVKEQRKSDEARLSMHSPEGSIDVGSIFISTFPIPHPYSPSTDSGGYGNVFKIDKEFMDLKSSVAVKLPRDGKSLLDEIGVINTLSEANKKSSELPSCLIAQGSSDNLVTFQGAFFQGNKLGVAMEYANHGHLGKYYFDKKWHEKKDLKDLALLHGYELAKAISYCHEKKYAHHDIKLENAFVRKDYSLCLSDFGSAKYHGENQRHEHLFFSGTTPAYWPPEMAAAFLKSGCSVSGTSITRGIPHQYPFSHDIYDWALTVAQLIEDEDIEKNMLCAPDGAVSAEERRHSIDAKQIMMSKKSRAILNGTLFQMKNPVWEVFPALKTLIQACMNPEPGERPTMAEVLNKLQNDPTVFAAIARGQIMRLEQQKQDTLLNQRTLNREQKPITASLLNILTKQELIIGVAVLPFSLCLLAGASYGVAFLCGLAMTCGYITYTENLENRCFSALPEDSICSRKLEALTRALAESDAPTPADLKEKYTAALAAMGKRTTHKPDQGSSDFSFNAGAALLAGSFSAAWAAETTSTHALLFSAATSLKISLLAATIGTGAIAALMTFAVLCYCYSTQVSDKPETAAAPSPALAH